MFIWSIMALVRGTWQLAHNAWGNRLELPSVKRVIAVVPLLLYGVIFCLCIFCALSLYVYGLPFTAWISIIRLMEQDHYGDKGEGRTNMDPAHNLMYTLCVAQFVLYLNRYMLRLQEKMIMKQVSEAYGFQDDDSPIVGYYHETMDGCMKNPFFDRERNLVTYSLELMESNTNSPLSDNFLSGTLILHRLLTWQHSDKIIRAPSLTQQEEEIHQQQQQQQSDLGESEPLIQKDKADTTHIVQQSNKKRQQQQQIEEEVIVQQRRMIKRLIGAASSTHIVQKLLETLDSRRTSDKKMREAAARILEHVTDGIRLELFPRGIQCIASLINTFEEYRRLQPDQSSSSSSDKKEAARMTLPPPPNTKNGQGQGQGSSNINTSSSEWKPEYSESESEPDSDSEVDGPSLSDVLTRLRIRWRRIISKGSSTATTTSSKSESDNGMGRPSSSECNRSKSNPFHGYKELVLTGLAIFWRLVGSEDNCTMISNTKHLVSKIMAPISYDLVHLAGHSAWSTQVVQRSLGIMLRLIAAAKGDTRTNLHRHISRDEGAITTMKEIVTCEECKGGELQMKAMQILTQLCIDETANRGNPTKVLISIFVNGDSSNGSIKKTAGETLVVLFVGSKSVAILLPKEENDEFVGDLAKILVQVGVEDACRKSAAEILEHLCIHYAENVEYLSTLKNTITGVMPEVLKEMCHRSTGEEEKHEYARSDTEVESQSNTKKKSTSSSPAQNQQHKLHVALLSLCMMACDKLNLDLDAISMGEGRDQPTDLGESVTFSLATKMVQLNRDIISPDSLTVMKLSTKMIITAMKKLRGHGAGVKRASLESLMDSLSSVSEIMLDLEGCMVFTAGTTMTKPASVDTLSSLVKQARQLHSEIKDPDSEIAPAS